MGFFDLFKKKKKFFICARCKKEITDAESNWIGNHRFCSDCAAPPKVTISPKQAVITESDKIIANEKKQREKEIILQEIFEIVSKYNDAFPNEKVYLDNIFIGKCVNNPGSIGCIYRGNGWYLYRVDERFNLLQNGPFSLNGIIVALSYMLYIPAELQNREFDAEEYKLYLSGEKPI